MLEKLKHELEVKKSLYDHEISKLEKNLEEVKEKKRKSEEEDLKLSRDVSDCEHAGFTGQTNGKILDQLKRIYVIATGKKGAGKTEPGRALQMLNEIETQIDYWN